MTVQTAAGIARPATTTTDTTSPLVRGLWSVTSGRLPRAEDEVVVSASVLPPGSGLGDRVRLVGDGPRRVVGLVELPEQTEAEILVAPTGGVSPKAPTAPAVLVGGTSVSWSEVRAANAEGVTVLSRSVLIDPPAESAVPTAFRFGSEDSDDPLLLAGVALILTMVVVEIALLAGPAFAVGARR